MRPMKTSSFGTIIPYRIKECEICNPQYLRNSFDEIMYEKSFAAAVDSAPLIIMSTCVEHDVSKVSGCRKCSYIPGGLEKRFTEVTELKAYLLFTVLYAVEARKLEALEVTVNMSTYEGVETSRADIDAFTG